MQYTILGVPSNFSFMNFTSKCCLGLMELGPSFRVSLNVCINLPGVDVVIHAKFQPWGQTVRLFIPALHA